MHRLVAETAKNRLPTVVQLKDCTISRPESDDRSLNRDSTSARRNFDRHKQLVGIDDDGFDRLFIKGIDFVLVQLQMTVECIPM